MHKFTNVCVYAICKNEEKNIKRWYQHVKDADLIVVLDTKSEDSSIDMLYNLTIYHSNLRYATYDNDRVSFSDMRNTALSFARQEIEKLEAEENIHSEWIFVSLDFDEFLEPHGIKNIRKNWNSSYDTMALHGRTGDSEQIVEHKVHSQSMAWKWIRDVHEIIHMDGIKQREWKVMHSDISYQHEQDLEKPRDYYALLLQEHEKNPHDIKTLLYLAWEAYNHSELANYEIYSSQCYNEIFQNKLDEFYEDPEYAMQCVFNMANAEYQTTLSPVNYDKIIYKIDVAMNIRQKYNFPDFRKIHFLKAKYLWASGNKINRLQAILEYEACLKIKVKPYSWIDDDQYYDNGLLYTKIANAYFYTASADTSFEHYKKALSYGVLACEEDNTNVLYQTNLAFYKSAFLDDLTYEKEETKVENKICVYAITKNESQFVEKWVESMKEADSIVVLDTGSTDDTVSKLKALGVHVVEQTITPWRFDVARNEALKLVPSYCNILVSTDLDEVLEPGWANILRERWIEGTHERAIYKYSWSHLSNGEDGRVFQYDKIHSRNWIWKYPVHELLWNTKTNTNLYDTDNVLYLFDEIHLHHYPDKTKSRSSYLPLLELRASENRDDYYGLIYLAHEYYYQSMYTKSISTLEYILMNYRENYNSVEQASCYLFIGDSYTELKDYKKAKDSYLNAINIEPTYREPYLNLAKVYIAQELYEIAIAYVHEAFNKTYRHYTWVERDISWTYEPYDLLSLASFYSGKKRDSLAYAIKASSYDPSDERLSNNVSVIIENTTDAELLN